MPSIPPGPYVQGYTRATMAGTKGSKAARWSKSQKAGLSSDWSLQLDSMTSDSQVIPYQRASLHLCPDGVDNTPERLKQCHPNDAYLGHLLHRGTSQSPVQSYTVYRGDASHTRG